ncbi:uncharacterized protein TRAVEDRAFT_128063, partial [Trametes versicolor FP-101664 SS1]|uniref:uncharacterized protein n=1 Tax=Trametes versicolor (strain FP-101664) TaxID=717944 RepID=UPI0004622DE2
KRLAHKCLNKCPVEVNVAVFQPLLVIMDAYWKGLSGKAAEWVVRKQKSHQRVGTVTMMSIEAVLN